MRPLAAALLLFAAVPGAAAGRDRFLADFPAALAAAKERNDPIFVEVWVPW